MNRALELAAKARGYTSPNPMVGAVIVRNGRIVGEGYHRRAGQEHAETAALRKAGRQARGATMYVTLEPCCHVGCTGPCTEAIINAGISRVVYAMLDPNPIVKGKGDRELRNAGLKVSRGVLRRSAEELNEAYLMFHKLGRPFVTLKMAQSIDGRIATITGESKWISSPASLKLAHRLRAENDAVMVGAGTVRADNPALTVRLAKGRNPYRIVVAGRSELPTNCQLLTNNRDLKTVVAKVGQKNSRSPNSKRSASIVRWELKGDRRGQVDVRDLLQKAAAFGLQSILVEGGSSLATALLKAELVDKVVLVIAPKIIGHGTPAIGDLGVKRLEDGIELTRVEVLRMGMDLIVSGYPKYSS